MFFTSPNFGSFTCALLFAENIVSLMVTVNLSVAGGENHQNSRSFSSNILRKNHPFIHFAFQILFIHKHFIVLLPFSKRSGFSCCHCGTYWFFPFHTLSKYLAHYSSSKRAHQSPICELVSFSHIVQKYLIFQAADKNISEFQDMLPISAQRYMVFTCLSLFFCILNCSALM